MYSNITQCCLLSYSSYILCYFIYHTIVLFLCIYIFIFIVLSSFYLFIYIFILCFNVLHLFFLCWYYPKKNKKMMNNKNTAKANMYKTCEKLLSFIFITFVILRFTSIIAFPNSDSDSFNLFFCSSVSFCMSIAIERSVRSFVFSSLSFCCI